MTIIKLFIQQICFMISKMISLIFYIFPVKKNKIFLYSYRGNKYSCNQKGFTEYVLSLEKKELEIVWGYSNEVTKNAIPNDVKKVKMRSLKYFYELYTSKFICTNQRVSCLDFFSKRKDQIYIQTWHASAGIKAVEMDAVVDLPKVYIREAKRDSKMCDYIVSGSRQLSEFYKSKFWYNGPLLEIGTMRNDVFFHCDVKKKESLKEKYGFLDDKKIILYAPTFRNNSDDLSINYDYDYGLDFERVHRAFGETIGDNIIVIKQHPNLINHKYRESEYCKDMTEVQDIQELLLIADVLISDYSSVTFDYILMKKPLYIFAKDFQTYSRDLLMDFNELPCGVAMSNAELEQKILSFNNEEYLSRLEKFSKECLGSFEQGIANKEFYNFLIEKIKE